MASIYGKTVAVFHSQSIANYLDEAALAIILSENPAAKVINTYGDDQSAITAHIAELSAGAYDDIFVLSAVASTHASGKLTYDDLASLRAKLKVANRGTAVVSGTVGTADSTTSIAFLETVGSLTGDYYNGLYFVCTAGTHSGTIKKILDYSATTQLATMGGAAVSGAWDNTDVYTIYTVPHLQVIADPALAIAAAYIYDTDCPAADPIGRVWNYCHDNTVHPIPEALATLSAYGGFYRKTGTSSAGSTSSLTTSGLTIDAEIGNFIFGVSGTGIGQYARIADNSATVVSIEYANGTYNGDVITGDSTWTSPSNDTVFYITEGYAKIFANKYMEYWVKTYGLDPTDGSIMAIYQKLIDEDRRLHLYPSGASVQNYTTYADCKLKGKAIYDAIVAGVVS